MFKALVLLALVATFCAAVKIRQGAAAPICNIDSGHVPRTVEGPDEDPSPRAPPSADPLTGRTNDYLREMDGLVTEIRNKCNSMYIVDNKLKTNVGDAEYSEDGLVFTFTFKDAKGTPKWTIKQLSSGGEVGIFTQDDKSIYYDTRGNVIIISVNP